jgi:hypothetical protein
MSEMKLIMERWDKYLIKEEFDACPNQPVDVDTFITGVELAMMEKEAQKKYIKDLKRQGKMTEKLDKVFNVISNGIGVFGMMAMSKASVGAQVVAFFAGVINAKQQKAGDAKIDDLLKLLCIDGALLDTISNDIEKTYWTNSGIQDEVETYISRARATPTPEPMLDFTKHLVDWLNTNGESPYAATDTDGIDTDIVVR